MFTATLQLRGARAAIALLAITMALVTAPPVWCQTAEKAEDKPENYPDGPHRENTFYFCTACHSFKLVAQQRLNRDQWNETLDWMQEKHALPKTEGEGRNELLDYLSTAFPAKAKAGWRNPFQ
ncbi:MAG: hypothetical protein C0511_02610 [Hyphomicrobium sp.]|nr:hypothetical protein [Hyphomicrobium sp.]